MKQFLNKIIRGPATLPLLLLIVVASVIIYGNTFDNTFIFDDYLHLKEGTLIRNFFRNFEWGLLLISRNIVNLTFALNYKLGGLHVFGYHLVNLVIHILNGIVVFFLSSLMLRRLNEFSHGTADAEGEKTIRLVSLFAALIFVSHPLQTQAVTYVIQRYTSVAALFYLSSLLFYLKARIVDISSSDVREKSPGKKRVSDGPLGKKGWQVPFYYGLFLVCAALAFLSKQNAASLPLAVLAVEYFFVDRRPQGWVRKIPWMALGFVLWGVFVLHVSGFFGLNGPGEIFEEFSQISRETESVGRWTYLLTQFNVLVVYLRLFFLPVNQSLDYLYPFSKGFFHGTTPYAFLFLLSLAGAAVGLRKKLSLLSFGVFWFFITLSVESSIIPIKDALFEHRLYLPLFGLSLALADGVFRIFRRREAWAVGLLTVLVVTLSVATHLRNRVWQDGVTVWSDVLTKNPRNVRAYNNLALAFSESGDYDKAEEALKEALRIQPTYETALVNMASLYQKRDLPGQSLEAYRKVLELYPENVDARVGLGEALKEKGKTEEARAQFEAVLEREPGNIRAKVHLAELLALQDKFGESAETLAETLDADPENPAVLVGMGNLKRLAGEGSEAFRYYAEALRIDPDSLEACLNMAALMFQEKRYGDAERYLKEALRIKPDHGEARNDLGALLLAGNRLSEAREEFEKAVEIDPKNKDALFNLGSLYQAEGNAERAADYYEKALTVDPANWEAAMRLGGIRMAGGDLGSAREWFEKSLNVNPANARLQNRMAIVLMKTGDYDGAWTRYRKAAEIDGALKPVVLYNLACLESLRNRKEASLSLLEEAFLAGYGNCGKAGTDGDLENARKHPRFSDLMKTYCKGGS